MTQKQQSGCMKNTIMETNENWNGNDKQIISTPHKQKAVSNTQHKNYNRALTKNPMRDMQVKPHQIVIKSQLQN